MPELMDERRGRELAQHLRREREVIILNPDDRFLRRTPDFIGYRVREFRVHFLIHVPVFGAILEVLHEHVTEGPERAVGKPHVVAIDLGVAEEDAAQGVAIFARRHAQPAFAIGGFRIGGA